MKEKNSKEGFTLVELLAVIVILAIILVIAVPKVMSVIEDAKKATLESSVKMIASAAEKVKVQNTVLGKDEEITCESVAKINNLDYDACSIEFVDNTAKVTIKGKGKFAGLHVCNGTKTDAEASDEECDLGVSLNVKQVSYIKPGEDLKPSQFQITLDDDGEVSNLWAGGLKPDDTKAVTITTPNWPEEIDYFDNNWEYTFDGAEAVQVTFNSESKLVYSPDHVYVAIYDKNNQVYKLTGQQFSGKTYTVTGNYIKIELVCYAAACGPSKLKATIKPVNNVETEYIISPNVAPNVSGNFDVTIKLKSSNISETTTAFVSTQPQYGNASKYIEDSFVYASELNNNLEQQIMLYDEINYDSGIRYVGTLDEVNNKVYYNCEDIDSSGVAYGEDGYNYASSCEVWRIIGVFDVDDGNGNRTKRVKLVNINSTFEASWDSCYGYVDEFFMEFGDNLGYGSSHWGEVRDVNGNITYPGADLMQLLNGYYIGKEGASCLYCDGSNQSTCSKICDTEDKTLKSQNMKKLTSVALNMINNAIWSTNGVHVNNMETLDRIYWEDSGIAPSYKMKSKSWTGLVGLMSVSDVKFSNGWMYYSANEDKFTWTMSNANGIDDYYGYTVSDIGLWVVGKDIDDKIELSNTYNVWPSVYLKSDIKIIDGNGNDKPYILGL